MADAFRRLDIDPEAAARLATAYTGYGEACWSRFLELRSMIDVERKRAESARGRALRQLRSEAQNAAILAASSYCIGASYFALVNSSAAKLVYWAAASAYAALGLPYGAVLAICADDPSLEQEYWSEFIRSELGAEITPQNAVPVMLTAADMLIREPQEFERAASVISRAAVMSGALVGNALIPMGLYHDLAFEARDIASNEFAARASRRDRYPRATLEYFKRWGERLQVAQLDRFHWHMLHAKLLPTEPEAVATGVVVVRAAQLGNSDVIRVFRENELSAHATVAMEVAMNLNSTEISMRGLPEEPMMKSLFERHRRAGGNERRPEEPA